MYTQTAHTQSVGKPPGLPKAAQGFSGTLPSLWHTHTHTVHFLLAGLEAELARRMTRASFTAW